MLSHKPINRYLASMMPRVPELPLRMGQAPGVCGRLPAQYRQCPACRRGRALTVLSIALHRSAAALPCHKISVSRQSDGNKNLRLRVLARSRSVFHNRVLPMFEAFQCDFRYLMHAAIIKTLVATSRAPTKYEYISIFPPNTCPGKLPTIHFYIQ